MEENQTMRIVVLGKTGVGKSSLANMLSGKKGTFKDSASPNSETKKCFAKTVKINERKYHLIDTPGLFDTDLNSTELSPDMLKCIKECTPGPHAFLIVLRVERYTQHEQEVVNSILKYLLEEAQKYTTLVFTHGDDLPEGMNIKDWAKKNEALKTLVQKCGGRCHMFDNKYWNNSQHSYRNNQNQVRELLKSIEVTVRGNNGKYYTNNFLEKLIENIKKVWFVVTFPVRVWLGALLGTGEFESTLFERNLFAEPSTDEDNLSQQGSDTLRIVLFGKSGSGKSSLGNTIFGDRQSFTVNHGSFGSTRCQSVTKQVNGRNVQLIDTQGISDLNSSSAELNREILKCITECAPGPHAFLLVFKVERFTRQEQTVVELMLKYFSEEALKFTTVVFTQGGYLPEGVRIEEWVSKNEALKTLVQKCGGRCHVFDNRYWNTSLDPYRNNQYQVKVLLQTIDQTMKDNEGKYYTSDMLQQVQTHTVQKVQQKPQSFLSWLFGS